MALRRAKIQPTLQEKRYTTLQILEAAYVSGNRVLIHPVETYDLSTLSKEIYTYGEPIETYVIYDERPKVYLLKKLGWFREDEENLPQIAYIPTHLLYRKYSWDTGTTVPTTEPTSPSAGDVWFDTTEELLYTYNGTSWDEGRDVPTDHYYPTEVNQNYVDPINELLYTSIEKDEIVNEVLLEGDSFQSLVESGESDSYILKPLKIKRGTLLDVFYDYAPDVNFGEQDFSDTETDPYDFAIDSSETINRFYVTESRIDTVSINYTCKLAAYKYQASGEAEEDQNPSNGPFLNFNSDEHGA